MKDEHKPFSEWLKSRPPEIQELMVLFPLGATVRTKEGVRLLCPAPGTRGTVVSWFEAGTVGVVAQMQRYIESPITGRSLDKGDSVKGECLADHLEVVSYAEIAPGVICDGALVRSLLDA